ncbi:hypothetical protein [Atlantibacter hermannii]|uniref:hypothetical protein n=1 Tax=Atlantibacter hermannii TaxID=565 RepID=UPI0028B2294E|nr:hypothetical protein [Atlantibacter hermannii]
MNNDNNISQTVAISEATQKPTRQRFIVLAILFVSLSVIYHHARFHLHLACNQKRSGGAGDV